MLVLCVGILREGLGVGMGLRVTGGSKMEQEAWVCDGDPGRGLEGVKVAPPPAAAETRLCLTRTHTHTRRYKSLGVTDG